MLLRKNDKILFFGDSVTDCGRARPVGEGINVHNPLGSGYPNLVAGFLQVCYPEYNARIVNMGTSGDNSSNLLERFDCDVKALSPDILVIMIGANDAWRIFDAPAIKEWHIFPDLYENNLFKLINKSLEITNRIILMTPYIIDNNQNDPMYKIIQSYGEICKKLAEQYNLILVDTQSAFEKVLQASHSYALSWDRIHPGIGGHTLLSRLVLKALGTELDRKN